MGALGTALFITVIAAAEAARTANGTTEVESVAAGVH